MSGCGLAGALCGRSDLDWLQDLGTRDGLGRSYPVAASPTRTSWARPTDHRTRNADNTSCRTDPDEGDPMALATTADNNTDYSTADDGLGATSGRAS